MKKKRRAQNITDEFGNAAPSNQLARIEWDGTSVMPVGLADRGLPAHVIVQ